MIALKCRTAPVADAVAECRAALAWLRDAGASQFFWKYCSTFDSTAEGNIGPVAEALMDDLGTDQTIYCPAFPENGRSIFMGNLFVGRQPLAKPMKDHPLTPMRDSSLMRLLEPQVTRPVGLADRLTVARGAPELRRHLARLCDDGVAHVVVDAVANEDLQTIAESCRDMMLMTGGSAVAMPLPKLYRDDGLLAADAPSLDRPDLPAGAVVLSGSCSAMTNEQVAAFNGGPSLRLDPGACRDRSRGGVGVVARTAGGRHPDDLCNRKPGRRSRCAASSRHRAGGSARRERAGRSGEGRLCRGTSAVRRRRRRDVGRGVAGAGTFAA